VTSLRAGLSDIGWLLLVVWALPIVIVVLGLPLAAAVAAIHAVLSRIW
jgi:hypothetical protein